MKTTTISITEIHGTELCHKYPGQTDRQPCYIELDCANREMSAETNPEIGNARPMRVVHGHIQRFGIPALKASAANYLMRNLTDLAVVVCDGYSSEWDGHNHVARFDDDATAALEAIDDVRNRDWDENDQVRAWSADDYFGAIGSTKRIAEQLGVTGATTDAELETIAEREEAAASADGIDELTGTAKYLEWLREQVRE